MTAVHDESRTHQVEQLLDVEGSIHFLGEPGITSASFFSGADHERSVAWLKDRLKTICEANPWLVGRLIRARTTKKVSLSFPKTVTENDVDALLTTTTTRQNISANTPYRSLCDAVVRSGAMVKPGYSLLGKDDRVAKFTLVPCADDGDGDGGGGRVALIASVSHAVADGHTYYRVLSMLSGPTESLSAKRRLEYPPRCVEAVGEDETRFLFSPALTCNAVFGVLRCRANPPLVDARFVDERAVSAAKRAAASRTGSGDGAFACSTNDVVTSAFGRATRARVLLMAVNLRGRLRRDVVDERDAGNYETVIPYDPVGYDSPEHVRESLRNGPPFRRRGARPMPGTWETLRLRWSMITSWIFPGFRADLTLLDASRNPTEPLSLHVPIIDANQTPEPLAVVFRPCVGRLAVLYMGSPRAISYESMMENGAPLGDKVSAAMFDES